MELSLVIPIFNEAEHLKRFLDMIDALDLPVSYELILVDDQSTDGSYDILINHKFKNHAKIIRQPMNQGKGAALRKGIENASGRFIGIQDADFEYSPEDIPSLLLPLMSDKCDVVLGSRFKKNSPQVHRTFHYLINRILTALSNVLSGLYLTDMETCYKFFKSEIIKNIKLESDRFGFEPEITAKIAKLKIRVMELPISYYPRNYLEGKKITWKDGIAAFWHIFFYNVLQTKSLYLPSMPHQYLAHSRQWF